jgi:aspartyl-tRNA(Asn)/glutamyl-tRNA(Gln) amidotransferase subunit A
VPLAVKDIVSTEGMPTTAQSLVLDPAWGAQGDAPVVTRLREAGAVITGKTSTMEFAIGLPDPAKPFPVPRNPWNTDLWSGGSSSGAANGVATGMFYGCISSDTGGSIRMPAAMCGVTGIKPTFGRVPKNRVVPLSWSFDHVGPISRTARDCAVMLRVLAGHDPADPRSLDVPVPDYAAGLDGSADGLRVGVLRQHHLDAPFVDPIAVERFEAAVADLERTGATVEEITIPHFDLLLEAGTVILMSEALAYHRPTLQTRWHDYGAFTRVMVPSAAFYTAADFVQAQRVCHHLRAVVDDVLTRVDLIATPTLGAGAPAVDGLDFASVLMLPVFTPAWNALGLPAISVPCGFTDAGSPLGLQLAGRALDEATVLRAADAYQQVTDWHTRVPPMATD